MATIQQCRGLVLRTVKHGESSLILTIFARDAGVLGLMAKGVRGKTKAGSAAGLAPFTEGQFVYYVKAGRELQLLKEWALDNPHLPLREDLDTLAAASAIMELLLRCLRDGDPHPELFDIATESLRQLERKPALPLVPLWAFALQLYRELGFGLRLNRCADTARDLIPPFGRPLRYRLGDGGFLHPEAATRQPVDGHLAPDAFAILARLDTPETELHRRLTVAARTQRDITEFLIHYLEAHLPVRGTLKSLDALHWQAPAAKQTAD